MGTDFIGASIIMEGKGNEAEGWGKVERLGNFGYHLVSKASFASDTTIKVIHTTNLEKTRKQYRRGLWLLRTDETKGEILLDNAWNLESLLCQSPNFSNFTSLNSGNDLLE
jgi:hypothetical protein